MIKRYLTPLANNLVHSNNLHNPTGPSNISRGYKVVAGVTKQPVPRIYPLPNSEESTPLQSDVTGLHKIVCVKTCKENQCHNRQCDSNESHKVVCPNDPQSAMVGELAGALTHTIPLGKEGIEVSDGDINKSTNSTQKMVTEKTAIPLELEKFKEKAGVTTYVQKPQLSAKIVASLPANSVIKLKNTSTIETSIDNDSP